MVSAILDTCADIEPQLNKIWQEFRKDGITDDLAIVEHLSYLLLAWHTQVWSTLKEALSSALRTPLDEAQYRLDRSITDAIQIQLRDRLESIPKDLIPEPPKGVSPPRLFTIALVLEDALKSHDPGELLNHCLLKRLPRMYTGGRYPTPRHITQTMAQLVDVKTGESLADFACGSGGLLVAAAHKQPRVTGVEISPNWARIAWANVILHGLPQPRISIGNSLSLLAHAEDEPPFDCILMNPPFGETIDQYLLAQTGSDRFGKRSEIALTGSALTQLIPGGRAAVLLPVGALDGKSSGEQFLRKVLLGGFLVQAVVTLPRDALQPFTNLKTYLLVIQHSAEQPAHKTEAIWFYRVEHDGFTSGRNRQPEPEKNELPRLEAAIHSQVNIPTGDRPIAWQGIRVGDGLVGYHILRNTDGVFAISHLRSADARSAGLLATLEAATDSFCVILRDGIDYAGPRQFRTQKIVVAQAPPTHATHRFVGEGIDDISLSLNDVGAQIKKGKQVAEADLWQEEEETKPVLLVVNPDGYPTSPALTLDSMEDLPRPLQVEVAGAFPLEDDDKRPAGHVLIFGSSLLDVVPLTDSDGKKVYLADLADTCLLLWPDEEGHLTRIEVTQNTKVFAGEPYHQGVALDLAGQWLGVQVPVGEIERRNLSLQPSEYFPKEAEARVLRSPAELLAEIKTTHAQLDRRINYLLGIVELRPVATATMPPSVAENVEPFGTLSNIQKDVWRAIQAQVEDHAVEEGGAYRTPRPFRLEDVSAAHPAADVQRALELFGCMGLIVRITIGDAPYYRLVAAADVVPVETAQ